MDETSPKWTAPRNHNRWERECRGVGRYFFITKKLFLETMPTKRKQLNWLHQSEAESTTKPDGLNRFAKWRDYVKIQLKRPLDHRFYYNRKKETELALRP